MSRILAFDFGASSGRAMIAQFVDGRITMEEIHRFTNDPVSVRETLYWDALRLFFNIKQGITRAVNAGGFDMIGIDTWGVDFGLIGWCRILCTTVTGGRNSHTAIFSKK